MTTRCTLMCPSRGRHCTLGSPLLRRQEDGPGVHIHDVAHSDVVSLELISFPRLHGPGPFWEVELRARRRTQAGHRDLPSNGYRSQDPSKTSQLQGWLNLRFPVLRECLTSTMLSEEDLGRGYRRDRKRQKYRKVALQPWQHQEAETMTPCHDTCFFRRFRRIEQQSRSGLRYVAEMQRRQDIHLAVIDHQRSIEPHQPQP